MCWWPLQAAAAVARELLQLRSSCHHSHLTIAVTPCAVRPSLESRGALDTFCDAMAPNMRTHQIRLLKATRTPSNSSAFSLSVIASPTPLAAPPFLLRPA